MKRTLAVVLGLLVISGVPAFASSVSSPTFTMKANIPAGPSISVKWFKTNADPSPANEILGTLIDFGDLVLDAANHVYNNDMARLALITASNHKTPYTVSVTASSLTNGTDKIPDADYKHAPTYVASDNGGVTEGSVGATSSVVGTNLSVYTSGGTHALRVSRDYVSITNVPEDTKALLYTGTLTFTVTG